MFEYHGWITARETAVDDEDDVRLRRIVEFLAGPPTVLDPAR